MKLSLPPYKGSAIHIKSEDLAPLLSESRKSPRKRMIQPIQRTEAAPVQRLLNAFQLGTYIKPHKHSKAGASETIVLLQGKLGIILFDVEGNILDTITLETGSICDMEPDQWHTMVALKEDTVISEFKQGPYNPETDKEFAPWATNKSSVKEWESLF